LLLRLLLSLLLLLLLLLSLYLILLVLLLSLLLLLQLHSLLLVLRLFSLLLLMLLLLVVLWFSLADALAVAAETFSSPQRNLSLSASKQLRTAAKVLFAPVACGRVSALTSDGLL
jgi:hypothetical protein